MVPEESDAKGAVRSFHCFLDLFLVVNVALHNFRAQVRQSQGCLGERVSGDGTNRKGPARILQDSTYQGTTLCTSCTKHRDDLQVPLQSLDMVPSRGKPGMQRSCCSHQLLCS